jgi:4-aminobutyrate aminotransferase-like enzyme
LADRALDYGIFIRTAGASIIEIAPVFTFTRKDVDTLVDALDRSLSDVEKETLG